MTIGSIIRVMFFVYCSIRKLTNARNPDFFQDFSRMLDILLRVEFQGRISRVGFLVLVCDIRSN